MYVVIYSSSPGSLSSSSSSSWAFPAFSLQSSSLLPKWISFVIILVKNKKKVVLFWYPKDFTYVCPTELHAFQEALPEFDKRNVKVMGLSVDPVADHVKWLDDITDVCGMKPEYPIVADEDLAVAKLYNMLEADAGVTSGGRTAVDNETEAAIQRSLDTLKEGRTVIAIAHRLSTIRNADVIYVLEKGEIVESGSHDELVKLKKVYANLWDVQTGNKINSKL